MSLRDRPLTPMRSWWPDGPLAVPATPLDRRRLLHETWLVLGVGLGASAIYSVLTILRRLADSRPLNQQASQLNVSQARQSWLDLTYQLTGIALALVPVLLALHLLHREMRSPATYLGLDRHHVRTDLTWGLGLAALIGIPGLGLYLIARAAGLNTQVVAADLGHHWWSLPVLLLSAVQNAVLEEVVMVGYLYTRWTQAGWRLSHVVLGSALIRGTYHLYQGFGGFVGNIVMGLILGLVYLRTRRVLPLVITHAVLDIIAFVGYALLRDHVSWL
ncbi:CPBP family intramembrane glutamic endopeptidase [Luteipulveratus flavus]|uniref:CPBP family intramembrane metalloprotease n=1 Tax=Luteipulveratus flavus TaxID=3031728 RepID=A0ABT6CBM3_9MICO|nr:CPBP family intramembrane glutamic endopeptidase [Luteipulveratus sp. YIM 133296]MDF8265772.1 CPBP family intramembrane metalloprotease [Luteipulveratus sp. YIM 133296]